MVLCYIDCGCLLGGGSRGLPTPLEGRLSWFSSAIKRLYWYLNLPIRPGSELSEFRLFMLNPKTFGCVFKKMI